MSKAFIAQIIKSSLEITGTAAHQTTGTILDAIVHELRTSGKFTLPGFGTFKVQKMKARKALNPRNGESIRVKAGKTVRFKASPVLRAAV